MSGTTNPALAPGVPDVQVAKTTMREFTLNDADGKSHDYMLVQHPADEGEEILWTLVGLSGEPLGRLAVSVLDGRQGPVRGLLDLNIEQLLASVDWAVVGRDISSAVTRTRMPALTKRLLKYVSRDGQQLANELVFKTVFQANYSELLQLLFKVVEENRFLPL